MEFPKYFIRIEAAWQSPLYLTDKTNLIEVMEMVSGLFLSKEWLLTTEQNHRLQKSDEPLNIYSILN